MNGLAARLDAITGVHNGRIPAGAAADGVQDPVAREEAVVSVSAFEKVPTQPAYE